MNYSRIVRIVRTVATLAIYLSVLHSPALAANMDSGWRCWPDTQASWQNDTLYLPGDAPISTMPTNPPTGGWATLNAQEGIPVALPGTIEEHLAQFFKPGAPAPAGAGSDDQARGDAIYRGVSWWWRTFTAPSLKPGQRLILHVRGARLRSEVYCNGKLCGYSLLTELPFDTDVTDALKPGAGNLLAIRITNPGGFHDWNDLGGLIEWGKYRLPYSHGYGGLDRGITLDVRDQISVSDLAVLNRPSLHSVQVDVTVQSTGRAYNGPVLLSISKNGNLCWTGKVMVQVPAGQSGVAKMEVTIPSARPWSVDNPVLYQANASIPSLTDSGKTTSFGFRWLSIVGLDSDARLQFNGKRIVLRSAISWGYWAPSGLWASPEVAQREVESAKALGLNCIQAHRNMAKPEVLDVQDREGLLRYEEPGAGAKSFDPSFWNGGNSPPTVGPIDTSGNGGDTQDFTERYEEAKVLAMVKRDRSHPSVIIYSLQNEISPDLHNPRIFRVLREMQAEDPSRIILLKSGDQPQNQVLIQPWTSEIRHDDGTCFSGWLDVHTALHNSGGYVDRDYQDPTHYFYGPVPANWNCESYGRDGYPWYHSDNKKEILVWGEVGGVGVPDSHEEIAQEYAKKGTDGYDRSYHEAIATGYNTFLTDYGFRADFPTATSVFQAVGAKSYFFWQKIIENIRMSDVADEVVVSGWESTAVDNHSGVVDGHRYLRADPSIMRQATVPELLVIRPRHYIMASGDHAIIDVHLINESNLHGSYRLSFQATGPNAEPIFKTAETVQITGGDVYGQLLHTGWEFPVNTPGVVALTASLTPVAGKVPVLARTEKIQVVQLTGISTNSSVAVREDGDIIKQALSSMGVATVPDNAASCLIYSPGSTTWLHNAPDDAPVVGADDPRILHSHIYTSGPTTVGVWKGLARGTCQVELIFVENHFNTAGTRIYDMAINGQSVLTNFDPFDASGGQNREIIKKFTVSAPDGVVKVTVTHVSKDNALVTGVRITDSAGKVTAQCAYAQAFTDAAGQHWDPLSVDTTDSDLSELLGRVSNGMRLVIWPSDPDVADRAASALAHAGVVTYNGRIGSGQAAWLGSWYFVRRHWLFDGLPTACSMDWRYQVSDQASDGLLLTAPGIQVAAGYGKYSDPRVGMGAVVIPHGQGQIVLFDLPGLVSSLTGDDSSIHPVIAHRLLLNAIRR